MIQLALLAERGQNGTNTEQSKNSSSAGSRPEVHKEIALKARI